MIQLENYYKIKHELDSKNVKLIAVSKMQSIESIWQLYNAGQRDFGENYVQELIDKYEQLPKDIKWHFIGHLQTNKVKYIAPFIHLIHSIDSEKLLKEVNKEAAKNNRIIHGLLQIYIAQEETKFGFDEKECADLMSKQFEFKNVTIDGFMGMASFTSNYEQIEKEFSIVHQLQQKYGLTSLSIGMSGDYEIAIKKGSTMVRIGSLLFGKRK